jgi:RND superfamily putative drug exporter
MEAFFAALGRGVVRFRWPIVIAWIVIAVGCVAALPSLASVVKTEQSTFLPASSPSLRAQQLALRFNHQSNSLASLTLVALLPAISPSRSASEARATFAADQAEVTNLEDRIRRLPHVRSVQDFGTSLDGRARQALILAAVPVLGGGTADTLIKQIRGMFVPTASGVAYHLTGDLPINYDIKQQTSKANNATTMLSYLVIIVLLLFAFRALLAPLVTLLTAAVALLISGPIIAESTHLNVPVSAITEGVLIVLLLGAGTDYCVFLLSRTREEMRNGLTPHAAVARAVATVGESISFSAFTVMAALVSLLLASFGIYQSLGPPLAIGIAIMLVAGLTLLPALLAIFGRAVFWPSRPKPEAVPREGLWARTAERVTAFPKVTLVLGVLLFGALILGQVGVPTTGGFSTTTPSGTDSAQGRQALVAHFPAAGQNPEIVILAFAHSLWTDTTAAGTAQGLLAGNGIFQSVSGPFGNNVFLDARDIARLYRKLGPPDQLPLLQRAGTGVSAATYDAYRGLAQYFTPDGTMVQFFTILRQNDVNSQAALEGVGTLRAVTANVARTVGASNSGVFGLLPVAHDISTASSDDLGRIIPIVAILIAILLAVVLRSLVAPLYLVVSVVLSYLATLGLAAIVFVHLGSQANLNFVLPFVLFIFLMALGSDYNILVMSRIREEARALSIHIAVKRAIGATGTTVTTAGLILGGTFAAFAVAAPAGSLGEQSRQLGYGVAAGILLDTFLVRTLLVPSTVILLGRLTWWPSPLWRRTATADAVPVEIEQEQEPEREPQLV